MNNEPNKPIQAQELSEEQLAGIVGGVGLRKAGCPSLDGVGGDQFSMSILIDTSVDGLGVIPVDKRSEYVIVR